MADRAALTRGMEELARDWLVFSVCTVLLTPFALGLAGLVLLFGVAYIGAPLPADALGLTLTFEVFLGLSIVGTALGHARSRGHGLTWCGAAGLVLAAMVGLTHGVGVEGTPLAVTLSVGAVLVLGLLGWAYSPKDEYYLGWLGGRMDDPFSLQDDVDRAHLGLGFAVAIPRLILASWAGVVGDAWLWRGLSAREVDAAGAVLDALGGGDGAAASAALRPLGPRSSAHVLRALERMKFVRGGGGALRLTSAGARIASPGKPPAITIEQRRPDAGRVREG